MRLPRLYALAAAAAALFAFAAPQPAQAADAALGAPTMQLRTIVSGGMDRYYRVHVPTSWDGVRTLPVVLAFHGGGGNARQFANQSELYLTADQEEFLLVLPEGTGRIGGAPWFALQTWNSGNCCGWAAENNIDDVQFTRDMVAALASEWPVDLAHVYATGHSNGGMMSYRLGMEAPDLLAAIGPNAASLGMPGLPAAPIPVMAVHGRLDNNVPLQGGVGSGVSGTDFHSQRESLAPFAVINQTDPPRLAERRGAGRRFEATATGSGAPIHYWLLGDGGHSWPGHSSAIGDPVSQAIDINQELWAFFSSF